MAACNSSAHLPIEGLLNPLTNLCAYSEIYAKANWFRLAIGSVLNCIMQPKTSLLQKGLILSDLSTKEVFPELVLPPKKLLGGM